MRMSGKSGESHPERGRCRQKRRAADGRRNPEEITEMLAAKDRQSAGMTAYSNGLCLMEVSYEPYEKKDTIKKKDFLKKH